MIRVGDICKVINVGLTYTTYERFAKKHGHPDALLGDYGQKYKETDGRIVRVLIIDIHDEGYDVLAIVETIDEPYLKFIISVYGLKKVQSGLFPIEKNGLFSIYS